MGEFGNTGGCGGKNNCGCGLFGDSCWWVIIVAIIIFCCLCNN